MDISEWWPLLDEATRAWLIANNGDVVHADVLAAIEEAGGVVSPDAEWLGERDGSGYLLSDSATDFIEAAANGEGDDA